MKLKSIWLYVIVFIVVFIGSFLYMRMQATSGENFETFYDKFLTDSTFQMSRIPFPIEGVPKDPTNLDILNGFYWTAENWTLNKKIDYDEQGFVRELLDAAEGYKIEYIKIPELRMQYERRFILKEGKWYLIYFAYPKNFSINPPVPS